MSRVMTRVQQQGVEVEYASDEEVEYAWETGDWDQESETEEINPIRRRTKTTPSQADTQAAPRPTHTPKTPARPKTPRLPSIKSWRPPRKERPVAGVTERTDKRVTPKGGRGGATPVSAKPKPKRIGRAMYVATANDGKYGLIDTGEEADGCSVLIVHVPKKFQDIDLEIDPGDVLISRGVHRRGADTPLLVQFVGRSQYFSPGKRVSSCTIGVAAQEWKSFVRIY